MLNTGYQLGGILLSRGIISEEQLRAALDWQNRQGCRLGEALIALSLCPDVEVARGLAEQNGLRFTDLDQTPPSRDALRLIPREVAVEHGILPVRIEGSRLLVAVRDPYDLRIDEVVRKASGMAAVVSTAADNQLRDFLSRYSELTWSVGAGGGAAAEGEDRGSRRQSRRHAPVEEEQDPTGQKLRTLISDAVRKRATEVYFEPDEEGLRVRCRIDGHIHSLTAFPRYRMEGVLSRLKIMSGVAGEGNGFAQAGTFPLRVDGRNIELRSTFLPASERELLVLGIVDPEEKARTLEELGLGTDLLLELRRILTARQGMVLVAGPVGSGRRTTLNALLSHLHASGLHVMGLENSFERKLTGINQVQAPDGAAYPFAEALETCLSQRTDGVMVGDLPSREAAEIACRAAGTGQTVLAGSLATSSLRAITRLLDMGVAPHEVTASVNAVLSQRLVRRVCKRCAQDYRLPYEVEQVLRSVFPWPEGVRFRKGKGCEDCDGAGSRGCVGVFELLVVDDGFRSLLIERAPSSMLREHLQGTGFRPLEEDAFHKACHGLIAPEEIARLGMSVAVALDELAVKAAW
jgi:type II secretory ATPase GspE/PulE/Tfp pilus assembly ATPase PilB-like protein